MIVFLSGLFEICLSDDHFNMVSPGPWLRMYNTGKAGMTRNYPERLKDGYPGEGMERLFLTYPDDLFYLL